MADSLFKKLPEIWKDLDLRVSDVIPNTECLECGHVWVEGESTDRCAYCGRPLGGRGLLERFLAVPDAGVARIEDLIAELLRSHNIEKVRERFVPLFDSLTGHRWKDTKSYQWNRNRSEVNITRNSAKGSDDLIRILASEHGSPWCDIIDMASTVAVWNRQGVYTQNDDYFYDADFHHPGVFLLHVQDSIDLDAFLEDFQYIRPAGTKWYIYKTITEGVNVSIEMFNYSLPVINVEAGTNRGYPIFTEEQNFFDFVPQPGLLPTVTISDIPVAIANAYLVIDSLSFGVGDESIYLDDIFLNEENNSRQPGVEPQIPT